MNAGEIRFGRFRLNFQERQLWRDDRLVRLGGRALDLLCLLASAKGNVISKDELIAQLWPGRAVEEGNLHVQISTLRKALDKEEDGQSYIVTVPGRGYRLMGFGDSLVASRGAAADHRYSRVTEDPSGVPLALPDNPSIAVLPFVNLSGDLDQECFADGVAEDIITALSRYSSLFVIARNSSFSYKRRTVDVKEVGRELGVRYVLEGSLRKAGNRIRLTAQLVEAATGKHVWAERYDRDLSDIFAVQDDITEAATIAIAPAVAAAERQRAMRMPLESLDAWAAYQRGLWHFYKSSPEDNALAQKYFQQAIDSDPNFAAGYKGLAAAHIQAAGVLGTRAPTEAYSSAEALACRAVALDPTDAEAHAIFSAAMLASRGDHQGALAEAEQALAMSPNLDSAHVTLGAALIFSGQAKDGLGALQIAQRLDPQSPVLPGRLTLMALGLYLSGDYEAAVEVAKRVVRSHPDYSLAYRWLAAALGQLGRAAEAKEALEKAVAIAPALFDMYVRRQAPWHRPQEHAHMLEGLRKAGWKG